MLTLNNYKIEFLDRNNEVIKYIDNVTYVSFKVCSFYKNGFYYCVLYLKENMNLIFKGGFLNFGDEVNVNIYDGGDNLLYKFNLVVVNKVCGLFLEVYLYPKFFYNFLYKRYDIIMGGTGSDVIDYVINNLGISKKEVSKNYNLDKRNFYYLCMNLNDVVNDVIRYFKNVDNLSNFVFFIDYDWRGRCDFFMLKDMKDIMSKNSVLVLNEGNSKVVRMYENKFLSNFYEGLGVKGFWFDWSSGEFKKGLYNIKDVSKSVKTNFLSESVGVSKEIVDKFEYVSVVGLCPVGDDFLVSEEYNKCSMVYNVVNNNLFNVFLDLQVSFSGGLNVFDIAELNYVKINVGVNGDWVIYSYERVFGVDDISYNLVVSNSFFNNK